MEDLILGLACYRSNSRVRLAHMWCRKCVWKFIWSCLVQLFQIAKFGSRFLLWRFLKCDLVIPCLYPVNECWNMFYMVLVMREGDGLRLRIFVSQISKLCEIGVNGDFGVFLKWAEVWQCFGLVFSSLNHSTNIPIYRGIRRFDEIGLIFVYWFCWKMNDEEMDVL